MKTLLIGDVVGQPGRKAVQAAVPRLREERGLDMVVANVENLAGGFGVTRDTLKQLARAGVDVFTSGNHIWDKKEVAELWGDYPTLLRPANYPPANEGRGWCVFTTESGDQAAVLNLQGRVFMPPIDDPFAAADRELKAIQAKGIQTVFVDLHAEATSEKIALARYLDGRVSAVVGTHTHVATADARLQPGGTAALTDLGMTGPTDSVIGMNAEGVLAKFLTGRPARYQVGGGETQFWALLVQTGNDGKALSLEQIHQP